MRTTIAASAHELFLKIPTFASLLMNVQTRRPLTSLGRRSQGSVMASAATVKTFLAQTSARQRGNLTVSDGYVFHLGAGGAKSAYEAEF